MQGKIIRLVLVLMIMLGSVGLNAQNLVVTLTNTTTASFPISDIQSIKFSASSMILYKLDGTVIAWDIVDIDNYAFVCSEPTYTVTQPTCNNSSGTISVNTPTTASGITYTLEGITPVVAPLTNSTGVFSDLAGGNYSLTVADVFNRICSTSVNIIISPVSVVQSITLNDTICFGESYVFNGQSLIASDTYYDTLQSVSQCDSVVILNLTVLPSLTSIIDTTICNGDSLKVGNNVYFQGGTYNIPLQSEDGCDSSIVLKLGVNTIDTALSTSNNVISVSQSGASYQWIDCTSNISISNADQQTFTATVDGIYSVVISDGNCTDTSACLELLVSGIIEKSTSQFKIYPNPTSEGFTISGVFKTVDVNIYNLQGKMIWSIQNQQSDLLLNTKEISLNNSMYIIEIISGQDKEYYRLFVL